MKPSLVQAAITSIALLGVLGGPTGASPSSVREGVAATIQAHVRDIVAGINTHNVGLATTHDGPNIVVVQNDQPNTVGFAAEVSGYKQAFASDPSWHVSLIEETVDVAAAGDMAVYRSTYNQDGTQAKVPVTQKVNFISGWNRRENGTWTMDWYVVSEIEKPHQQQ